MPTSLLDLPRELIAHIIHHLPSTHKINTLLSLSYACRHLRLEAQRSLCRNAPLVRQSRGGASLTGDNVIRSILSSPVLFGSHLRVMDIALDGPTQTDRINGSPEFTAMLDLFSSALRVLHNLKTLQVEHCPSQTTGIPVTARVIVGVSFKLTTLVWSGISNNVQTIMNSILPHQPNIKHISLWWIDRSVQIPLFLEAYNQFFHYSSIDTVEGNLATITYLLRHNHQILYLRWDQIDDNLPINEIILSNILDGIAYLDNSISGRYNMMSISLISHLFTNLQILALSITNDLVSHNLHGSKR